MSSAVSAKARKRKYVGKPSNKRLHGETVRAGVCGVLLSCSVGQESRARVEVRNTLDEHFGSASSTHRDDDDDEDGDDDNDDNDDAAHTDFSAALASDLASAASVSRFHVTRFSTKRTGGRVFLRCSDESVDLVATVTALLRAARVRPSTRFTHLLMPVQRVCRADMDEVVAALTPLIGASSLGAADAPAQRWALVWKLHNCGGLSKNKADAAKRIAPLVDARHPVDLDAPETAVVVHAIEAHAFVAVLPHYSELCEFMVSRLIAAASE